MTLLALSGALKVVSAHPSVFCYEKYSYTTGILVADIDEKKFAFEAERRLLPVLSRCHIC